MKIGLCGTMSVGKTTLVNALKKETEFKNYRLDIHEKISSILGMYRYMPGKVITISGTTEERIDKIKESIDMYNI